MKERPILFIAPMVRALLDGSKTQTRRVVKSEAPDEATGACWLEIDGLAVWQWVENGDEQDTIARAQPFTCPYGQRNDRLWVRETWRTDASLDDKAPGTFSAWPVKYEADGSILRHGAFYGDTAGKTRVSIHMPRWASRIALEVTGVRVERLQDISEADCRAEGAAGGNGSIQGYGYSATPREHYRHIWESLNGPDSWVANPWVWAVEFKRITS